MLKVNEREGMLPLLCRTTCPSTKASCPVQLSCLLPGPWLIHAKSAVTQTKVAKLRAKMGKPFCPEGGRFMLEALVLEACCPDLFDLKQL